jgi:hypothetical protein
MYRVLTRHPSSLAGVFSLPKYRSFRRKLLDPDPTQNGRLALPKDRAVQSTQIFG